MLRHVLALVLVLACVVSVTALPGRGETLELSTLSFACEPDAKSKAAGATRFVDTLDVGSDTARSVALSKDGFADAKAQPKRVNGVLTVNVTFRKPDDKAAKAAYFIRAKPDGTLSGSLVRTEGGRTLRYTLGATSAREADEPDGRPKPDARAAADAVLDPEVLRVNGGFVRLMSAQAALADAGVKADKAKVAEILKAAGAHQNELRTALATGDLKPADYAKQADARLAEGHRALAELLADKAAKVEEAYGKPFAATYVYLNQMRAAAVEAGTGVEGAKAADHAVYQGLIDLTTQARQPGKLTPESAAKLQDRTRAAVLAALPADRHGRFERTLDGMAAYKPAAAKD